MELRAIAARAQRPVEEVITEALKSYVEAHKDQSPPAPLSFIGMFASGEGNLSERVDEIVGKAIEEDYLRQQREFAEYLAQKDK